ncbi:MAG TPA: nucleoside hydrolase [Candidatus Limnocylindrales bacterium]|nr:nucleoside hydrolase [Candidatus Limnocylindrales bacterium]
MTRIPLILDCDTGVDDGLAILYACASPDLDLLAVTCVSGNVPARQVAINSRSILELAGRSDVPVHLGAELPLRKGLRTAEDTHGQRGLGYAKLPSPSRDLAAGDGAEAIVDLARSRPGEVVLVTVGPLTNLALALQREPELPRLLHGYGLMGGAYRVPGNMTPTTEFNIFVDPDAARAVFAAWAAATDPTTPNPAPRPLAIGLDVTELKAFLPSDVARLASRAGCPPAEVERLGASPASGPAGTSSPIVDLVADSLRFYFEFHAEFDGFYGAYIHDPFALAATIDRSLVMTKPVFVDVEAGEGLAHGMTVADWRGVTHRPPNLDVAVDGRSADFFDRWIDRVGGLATSRSGVAR